MTVRYVVLRHEGVPEPHFDWMIEAEPGGALMTWRSLNWPIVAESALTRLADHRRAYLEYEGPVSGDRGHVKRVAEGNCHAISLAAGDLKVELPVGALRLRHVAGDRWQATVDTDTGRAAK